jgi:cytoskeleton protein RodZ
VTVGERLREARERQKVSLHAIAEKTNISVRFLDAIEKNQFDKLPGGIFTRGFIRSYAAQVGLDPDSTVAQFLSDEPTQRDDDIDEAPARTQGDGPALGTLLLAGLGAIVVAVAVVYLLKPQWLGLAPVTAPSAESASAGPAAGPSPASASSTPVTTPSPGRSTPQTPASASPAGNTSSAPAAAAATEGSVPEAPKSPLRLVVAPSGRCWVQVTADGQMRVARVVTAGERITVDAAERLHLVVGDAGNFAYELNGRPGKSLGVAGAVARATILPATVPQFQAP